MKLGDAFPSKYLKADDLEDHDWPVTIKSVKMENIGQGDDERVKLIVFFDELDKGLVCNKTNATTIAKLYGEDMDDWVGKRVTLWPNHDVQFKNEIVSAIRVRSRAPQKSQGNSGKKKAAAADEPADVMSFTTAIAYCEQHGIAGDTMKEYLHQMGITKWNNAKCTPLILEYVEQELAERGQPTGEAEDEIPF